MTKSIVYIGNDLAHKRNYHSAMESLYQGLISEDYKVIKYSSYKNKLLRLLHMLLGVFKNRQDCDLVLIDTFSTVSFYYTYAVSQLCRALNIPYICILHGGNLPDRLKRSPKMSRLIFNNAKHNVAPSKYLFAAFTQANYEVKLIPNTIDLGQFSYKKRSKIRPKLLWVRAFAELYNPSMALRVVSALKKTIPEISLCMVGPDREGILTKLKAQCVALGIENNVTFTGALSQQAWYALSEQYDVLINTTHVDNTPVSLIESMALGLPIVSTNVGGIPFLIEDGLTGLLVAADDVNRMTEQILSLLDGKNLHIADNARKLVESFDWKEVAKAWDEVLK